MTRPAPGGSGRLWTRALGIWILLMAVEAAHGTARALWLTPWLGDFRARQVSVFTGSLLIVAVTTLTIGWMRTRTTAALLRVGLLWLVLTVGFEVALGCALGYPWSRIAADYDLRHGGLMPLGLLVLTLAPWLAARVRARHLRHGPGQFSPSRAQTTR
jgi:hypothetical protein